MLVQKNQPLLRKYQLDRSESIVGMLAKYQSELQSEYRKNKKALQPREFEVCAQLLGQLLVEFVCSAEECS